jgi:uncharacterized protein (DUF2147 family)
LSFAILRLHFDSGNSWGAPLARQRQFRRSFRRRARGRVREAARAGTSSRSGFVAPDRSHGNQAVDWTRRHGIAATTAASDCQAGRSRAGGNRRAAATHRSGVEDGAERAINNVIDGGICRTAIDSAEDISGHTASRDAGQCHETADEPAQTPLGDWRTEGNKGSVRIERCGAALCGYLLDPSSNSAGEAVLINMKLKAAAEWSGNIYSRASGDTFYGTMAMKGPDSLRVEACALGQFFCTGNVWSRIGATPSKLVTYRKVSSEPRS